MKNLLLLLVVISLFSCQEEVKPTYAVFNGTVENNNAKAVKIFGNDFDKDLTISENGTFGDTLKIPNDGFYALRVGRESSPIYLTKGAIVGVTINVKEFDESLVYTGNLSNENNYLAAKYLLSEKGMEIDKMYSLPETDFLVEVNKLNDSYSSLLNATEGASEEFKTKESKELEYAHLNNIENYKNYHRYFAKDNEFEVSENFYDVLKDVDYSDLKAYNSSKAYKSLLETHFHRMANAVKEKEGISEALAYLQVINDNIPNGKEKDELMVNYLRYGMKADNSLEEVFTLYKTANPTSKNLPKLTKSYELLKTLTPGKASPTFKYENHKGGETSLADLKGKVVYVDVWATWCGPCKREIPFLKELDKDYHGKNIAFVSISIDEKKNYEAWRTMVTEKELGGYQLIADKDWKSKFVEDYRIKGIPRFLLIDAEGNIINADAPRPSSPEIRKMIDGLI
ncbi:MAG: TlpA family protein disulfide reductase [Flavobacteriaceae bacterium]|nr:TlpA family protein disulfide reductase [Flavobacteriaceae bacterium]